MQLLITVVAGGLGFSGNSLEEGSLGGSETAIICLMRELAARGHAVKVFCHCAGREGVFNGVEYLDIQSFSEFSMKTDIDVLIYHRVYDRSSTRVKASSIWVWNHDILVNDAHYAVSTWLPDRHLVLSEYQKKLYLDKLPATYRDIFITTRNGVDHALVTSCRRAIFRRPRERFSFCYTSRPERGALYLVRDIWPRVRQQWPDAELHIAHYDLQSLKVPEQVQAVIEETLQYYTRTPGVVFHGGLNKTDLYTLVGRCNAMLYPCLFPEISCISVMEAMAFGTLPITTDNFALPETVGHAGYLVRGTPSDRGYRDAFLQQVNRVIEHWSSDEITAVRQQGLDRVDTVYRWDKIAEEWEQMFHSFFEARKETKYHAVIQQLMYHDDIVAVQTLLKGVEHAAVPDPVLLEYKKQADHIVAHNADDPEEFSARSVHYKEYKRSSRFTEALRAIRMLGVTPERVLDVGCGNGEFICFMNQHHPGAEYVGLDYSAANIEDARTFFASEYPGATNATWYVRSVEELANPDRTLAAVLRGSTTGFNVVFAGEIVEHLADTTAFLTQLEQLVAPGGVVVITVPNGPWEAATWWHKPQSLRRHLHHFTLRDITDIFKHKKAHADYVPVYVTPRGELCGNWIVGWVRDETAPFGAVDYQRKALITRPYLSLSTCMIVRDAEDYISRCLKSVVDVSDEVIINDTGSTDSTLEIIQRLRTQYPRITVIHNTWEEDFSIARNQSIRDATGDWIFWIDADEELTGAFHIRKYLEMVPYNGAVINQCHLIVDVSADPDVPVRLFRNHRGVTFKGCVHEHPEEGKEGEFDKPVSPVVILPEVKVAHYGYVHDAVRKFKCLERNMPLLKKDRTKHPQRKLGLVLWMRDVLNFVDWGLRESKTEISERNVERLQQTIKVYRENFDDPTNMYFNIANPLYQKALMYCAGFGITPEGATHAPIHMKIAIQGAVGGIAITEPEPPIKPVWLYDTNELQRYFNQTYTRMCKNIGLPLDGVDGSTAAMMAQIAEVSTSHDNQAAAAGGDHEGSREAHG